VEYGTCVFSRRRGLEDKFLSFLYGKFLEELKRGKEVLYKERKNNGRKCVKVEKLFVYSFYSFFLFALLSLLNVVIYGSLM
jgi:hypothetical protein